MQDKRPTNATYGYDFRETSAASHAVVVQKVRKADFEGKDYTGLLVLATLFHVTGPTVCCHASCCVHFMLQAPHVLPGTAGYLAFISPISEYSLALCTLPEAAFS